MKEALNKHILAVRMKKWFELKGSRVMMKRVQEGAT
jgi:hypothetical protein